MFVMNKSRGFLHTLALFALVAVSAPCPSAQEASVWQLQDSGTAASLRGIHSVSDQIAWASGSNGTILRTSDGGSHWMKCVIPDADNDGAKLDFRGIQAWDENNAIAMSSGTGELSRLYKTTDGCKSWKLIFQNHDKEGFWDAIKFLSKDFGWLLGDPVNNMFVLYTTSDGGHIWNKQINKGLRVMHGTQAIFAASNSSLLDNTSFATGGSAGAFVNVSRDATICFDVCSSYQMDMNGKRAHWKHQPVFPGPGKESSGIFSIATRQGPKSAIQIAVGGDYLNPNESKNTAAFQGAADEPWTISTQPPHGYRSSVQWSESLQAWITVGTNGSDISRDDGKTWQSLGNDNWNALSLPFVVGPEGRIAHLNAEALSAMDGKKSR